MNAHPAYAAFPVINCGIDWLTVTQKRKGVTSELEDWAVEVVKRQSAGSERILPARRLGYVGHRVGNIFLGSRPADVMVQLSGQLCTPLTAEAIALSTNVSRIDLQVTVWTEGEQVNLAKWTSEKMVQRRELSSEQGAVTLISNWPAGDTLGINKRVSDQYGRLYDKTVESNLGPPRLVWRYEVELKGLAARGLAKRLARDGVHPTHVNRLVHAWYTKKGVEPAFDCANCEYASQPFIDAPKRDVLTWMRESLSKTIAKSIRLNGERETLDALGLSNYIRRETPNGGTSTI